MCDYLSGSSPRVWGVPYCEFMLSAHHRVIPTCVGSTITNFVIIFLEAGHPHVCGEYVINPESNLFNCGSSPRVWGVLCGDTPLLTSSRVIPTCVGSTEKWCVCTDTHAGHPHVCGEYIKSPIMKYFIDGSSPRVWGVHLVILNI